MKHREAIEENGIFSTEKVQSNAIRKAVEHANGINAFIEKLVFLNTERIEIQINDEHKFLIVYGFRKSEKFIYRYFLFGRNEWNHNSEENWEVFKNAYIEQLKKELSKYESDYIFFKS